MFQHTFIGLDVHGVSVVGCALNPVTGELVRMAMDSDPVVVLDWVRRFEPPVKAVYESGPTGYVLARHLREAGIGCVVAASSKLLCAPGDYPEDFVVPGFCRFAFALLVFVGSYSG